MLKKLFLVLITGALLGLSGCAVNEEDRARQQNPWGGPAEFQNTPPGMGGMGPAYR